MPLAGMEPNVLTTSLPRPTILAMQPEYETPGNREDPRAILAIVIVFQSAFLKSRLRYIALCCDIFS